ncbi:glycosyltransferase family A protein [Flavobacterium oreochromis]|uniref:glycosyltransferase family A protein n=1 Tax=Flavobacterium oreochromis TaxID=2906078 RepID=UPI00385C792D
MKKLVTIFTPTYNRGYLLGRLYQSLIQQKIKDFEWIIVDDGSTDNTAEVVQSFLDENLLKIKYIQQENSGKHIAINTGVLNSNSLLFFIVDSDDYLTTNAVSFIQENYRKIHNKENIAGFSGRKGYDKSTAIGTRKDVYDHVFANALNFRFKLGIKGDMAEVIKTDILKQFPFPFIQNEKFCPEALVWNRIALEYEFLWLSDIVYITEYLDDGLSANSFNVRKKAPETTLCYYSELSKMPIPFIQKLKAVINFWRFSKFSKKSFFAKWKQIDSYLSLICLPIAFVYALKN